MDNPKNTKTAKTISEKVEAALEAAGESRRSLAEKTGIPYTTLSRRLTDDGLTFTLLEVSKIADALEVSPNELVSPYMFSARRAA